MAREVIAKTEFAGDTGVLAASVTATELSYSGTNRVVHVTVYVSQIDYNTTRNLYYTITNNGATSSGSKTITTGTPEIVFNEDINVTVKNTESTGTYWLGISVTVDSQGYGNKTIANDGLLTVYGLTKIDDIPITSASDINCGENVSITWTPVRADVYNRLEFSIGGWTGSTGLFYPGTTSPYTYTGYTMPMEVAYQFPNSESGAVSVTMYTYSDPDGTAPVGVPSSKSFNVYFSQGDMPSISSCAGATVNTNSVVDAWGISLAGFTYIVISASVPSSGLYGSRVTKFNLSGSYDEYITSYNTADLSYIYYNSANDTYSLAYRSTTIQSSGTMSFNLSYTDSRGITSNNVPVVFTGGSTYVTFQEYQTPMIYNARASKVAFADNTIEVSVGVDSAYGTVGGRNILSAAIFVKRGDEYVQMWASANSGSNFTAVLDRAAWLVDTSSYTLRLVITDSLGQSAQKEIYLASQIVMMDFKAGGDGLGIGKVCESPGLEVAMETTFYGDVNVQLEKSGAITVMPIDAYIRDTMKIISSEMYGDSLPANPQEGQLFFRRV